MRAAWQPVDPFPNAMIFTTLQYTITAFAGYSP